MNGKADSDRECLNCAGELTGKQERFCCPRCRVEWWRNNNGIIPAKIQSISPTREGASVVVIRVQSEEASRASGLAPGQSVELVVGAVT